MGVARPVRLSINIIMIEALLYRTNLLYLLFTITAIAINIMSHYHCSSNLCLKVRMKKRSVSDMMMRDRDYRVFLYDFFLDIFFLSFWISLFDGNV